MNKITLAVEFLLVYNGGNKLFSMVKEVKIPINPSVGLEVLNVMEDCNITIERLALCMKTNKVFARSSRIVFNQKHHSNIADRFLRNGWVKESEYFRGKTMEELMDE